MGKVALTLGIYAILFGMAYIEIKRKEKKDNMKNNKK